MDSALKRKGGNPEQFVGGELVRINKTGGKKKNRREAQREITREKEVTNQRDQISSIQEKSTGQGGGRHRFHTRVEGDTELFTG